MPPRKLRLLAIKFSVRGTFAVRQPRRRHRRPRHVPRQLTTSDIVLAARTSVSSGMLGARLVERLLRQERHVDEAAARLRALPAQARIST